MKKFSSYLVLLGLALLTNFKFLQAQNVNVSGALVGNGTYVDLASAFTAINGGAQTGATINVDIVANTTEPATGAILNAGTWTSLTIRPQGGNFTVTGAATAGLPLIDLNGADNVLFDGLNDGINTLTISNTTVSATSGTSTIRLIGDATNNFLYRLSILGSSTMGVTTNGGVVYFAAGAVTTGNDNNSVTFCNIGPAGANLPTKGVYSSGTTTTTAVFNSNNIISNNNIFDFFSATTTSAGVYLSNGTTDCTVNNNRIYQTATRTQTTGAQHSGIWITSTGTAGNNFTVNNNTIGYNSSAGTGTYTLVGVASSTFVPIHLNVGTTTVSSVQGNTITNIAISGAASGTGTSAPFRAIYLQTGLMNAGNTTGNTIGSSTIGNAITFTSTSTSASDIIGIYNFSSSSTNISNNIIGGFSIGNSSTGAANFVGIRVNTAAAAISTITNNQIGGTAIPSIQSTALSSSRITGIQMDLSNATVTGNIIGNMALASGTGTGSTPAVGGIVINTSSSNHTISGNTISSIGSPLASVTGNITGIYFNTTGTVNTVSKNQINSLTANATTATLIGINVAGGTATYSNNMIRLGIDPSGAALTTGMAMQGINETAGTNNFYHNSVYIGGSGVGGAANTFAFQSTVTTNTRNYVNNIFYNARSNGAGTGKHYAIRVGGTAPNPAGLTSNNNDLFVNGTGGFVGLFNAVDQTTLANWQTAVGQDAASVSADPQYINPTGTALTGDLHINAVTPTVVEQGGILVAAITDDIDNQTRSGLTPTDIGADAGNFTVISCSSANGGTITPSSVSRCDGQTVSLTSVGVSTGVGISYQWMVSNTSGSGYVNVTGGTGATTSSYTSAALTPGTYYYVLQVTCSSGPVNALSNEVTVTVNPAPTISVTPGSGTICLPGGSAIGLTASGTSTSYAWLPTAGLTPTTGANVSAAPGATTTYTVTGTDVNSCTATATAVITVTEVPTISDISATPSSVCSGGNSQLLATGGLSTQYTVISTPYNFEVPSGSPTTIFISGDDAVSASVALPFGFFYFGQSYSNIFAYSNGFIQLGTSSGSTTSYGATIPTAAAPNNIIAGVWDDLNIAGAGSPTVRYFTNGTAPNRVFIVEYSAVKFYNSAANDGNITFQIKLFENGRIEIHHNNVVDPAPSNHYCGIENSAGTVGYFPPARNPFTANIATPEAWAFVPSGPTVTYAWSPATFLSSTTIANPMANGITATTTYTVTVSNGSCSSTASTTITSGAALTSTALTTNSPVCQGSDVIVTANPSGGGAPYTYSWTVDGGSSFTTPTATLTISGLSPGPHAIVSTVTDACTATTIQSTSVTVNPTPTASASSNSPICEGGAINLTGTTDVGTIFNWTGPNSFTSTTQNPSITSSTTLMSGTYSFTSTLGSCTSSVATTVVTVNPIPTSVSANSSSASICIGNTINLTSTGVQNATLLNENFNGTAAGWTIVNNSTGGTPAASTWTLRPNGYSPGGFWAAPLNSNDNTQFFLTNGDAQGSGSIQNNYLTSPVMDASSYTALSLQYYHYFRVAASPPDSAVVEVSTNGTTWTNVQSTIATTGTPTGFVVSNVNLNAYAGSPTLYVRFKYHASWGYGWAIDNVVLSGSVNTTFAWTSSPAGFTSSLQNPTAVAPTVNTVYTVTASNSFGCTATATTSVIVNPLPTVTASNTGPYCAGSTIQLNSTGASTDDWSGPSYSATDNQNPTIPSSTVAMSGVYTVTTTDVNGCSNTSTTSVIVNALPTVAASNTGPYCEGSTIQLNSTGASTDDWSGPSYSVTDIQNPTITGSTVANAGVYTVTTTDVNGCTNTSTTTVVVDPLPTPTATNTGPYCVGSTIQLNSPSGSSTDDWSGPASYSVTDVQNPTLASSTVAMAGVYTVTVTSVAGCTGTATTTVVVNPNPSASATNTGPYCVGTTIQLNSPSGSSTDDWSGPSAYSVTDVQNPTIASSTVAMAGDYTVTVTDGNGCSATATTTVVVNPLPTPTASNTGPYCVGSTIQLNASPSSSTDDWSGPSSYTSTDVQDPSIASATVAMAGDYTVTITDANGCSASATTTVAVNPLPTPTASNTGAYCEGATIQLNASPSSSTDDWSGPLAYSSTDVQDPTIASSTVAMSGVYTVTVTDANGCSATATTTVTVNPNPVVNLGADIVQPNPPAVLDAGSGFGSYLWSTTETTQTISVNTNGTYIVTVTTAGCSDSDTIQVNFTSGVVNVDGSATIMKLYPNPNNGPFNVQIDNLETNDLTIDILDMTGRVVYTRYVGSVSGNVIEAFDMTDLRVGMYNIRMTANGKSNTLRFVINR